MKQNWAGLIQQDCGWSPWAALLGESDDFDFFSINILAPLLLLEDGSCAMKVNKTHFQDVA